MSSGEQQRRSRTYYALTTQNAQMLGWRIVALGSDSTTVRQQAEAEIEQRNGALVQPVGTNIHTETELRNLVVVSEATARQRYGIREHQLDQFLAEVN